MMAIETMRQWVIATACALAFLGLSMCQAGAADEAATCLVMPWDAREGRVTFNTVNNTGDEDVVVHWVYWSSNCEKLIDVTTCQTPDGGDVQDAKAVENRRWIDGESVGRGSPISAGVAAESRGFPAYGTLYVSAFVAESGQFDDCRPTDTLAEDAIVGTWTVADLSSGAAAGGKAAAYDVADDRCVVPDEILDRVVIQTFAPSLLDFSSIIGHVTVENGGRDSSYPGELGPACARQGAIERPCVVQAQTKFWDNNEIFTSLPDVVFACSIQQSLLDGISASFSGNGTFEIVSPMIVPTDLLLEAYPVGMNGTDAGAFVAQGLGNLGTGHEGWRKTTVVTPEPTATPTPAATPEPTATPTPAASPTPTATPVSFFVGP